MVYSSRDTEDRVLDDGRILNRVCVGFEIQVMPVVVGHEWNSSLHLSNSLAPDYDLPRVAKCIRL